MKDVPVEQAVNLVVRAAGLAYERIGNSILVADAKSLKEETGLSSYVIELKYADADEVKAALKNLSADDPGRQGRQPADHRDQPARHRRDREGGRGHGRAGPAGHARGAHRRGVDRRPQACSASTGICSTARASSSSRARPIGADACERGSATRARHPAVRPRRPGTSAERVSWPSGEGVPGRARPADPRRQRARARESARSPRSTAREARCWSATRIPYVTSRTVFARRRRRRRRSSIQREEVGIKLQDHAAHQRRRLHHHRISPEVSSVIGVRRARTTTCRSSARARRRPPSGSRTATR